MLNVPLLIPELRVMQTSSAIGLVTEPGPKL